MTSEAKAHDLQMQLDEIEKLRGPILAEALANVRGLNVQFILF